MFCRCRLIPVAHVRQGKATSNFALRLPLPQSNLAQQVLKTRICLIF